MNPFDPTENIIFDNVLTDEEIVLLYKNIEETHEEQTKIAPRLGFKAFYSNFDPRILKKIEQTVQDRFGKHWVIKDVMFARYKNEWGYKPKLAPHFDDAFADHKLTFDLQMNGNVDWNIVVEDKTFLLKYNQALTFSGTGQIHWREKIDFSNDTFLDMLFCHFSMIDPENWKITEDWQSNMKDKEKMWQEKLEHFMEEEKLGDNE